MNLVLQERRATGATSVKAAIHPHTPHTHFPMQPEFFVKEAESRAGVGMRAAKPSSL